MQKRVVLEANQHSQENLDLNNVSYGSTTKSCIKFMENKQIDNANENSLLDRFSGLYRDYEGPLKTMPDLGETNVDNDGNGVIKLTQVGANFLNTLRTENEIILESSKGKNEKNSVSFKLSNG